MKEIDAGAPGSPPAAQSQAAGAVAPPERGARGNAAATVLAIVSEVRFVRDSLRDILGPHGGPRVAGAYANCADVLATPPPERPGMVLLDATLSNGHAAVASLRDALPGTLLVVFAISESVEAVLEWAEAGVDGYIPSTATAAELHRLVEDIHAGRQACSGQVAAGLLQRVAAAAKRARPLPVDAKPLTPREFEIVRLISQGLSNKDIARRLDIGVSTAKSHVHNALLKLHLERRAELASLMRAPPPQP